MVEKQNSQNEFDRTDTTQWILGIIVFIGSLRILEALGMSAPIAVFTSGVLHIFVYYWIPPRSRVPFGRYAQTTVVFWLGFVLASWPIPALLSKIVPAEIAYAIPAFVFTVSLYGLPILASGKRFHYGKNKQEIGFVNWIIGCGVFSVIVGAIVMISHLYTHALNNANR